MALRLFVMLVDVSSSTTKYKSEAEHEKLSAVGQEGEEKRATASWFINRSEHGQLTASTSGICTTYVFVPIGCTIYGSSVAQGIARTV